jgi:hypothetical protein
MVQVKREHQRLSIHADLRCWRAGLGVPAVVQLRELGVRTFQTLNLSCNAHFGVSAAKPPTQQIEAADIHFSGDRFPLMSE